jgi:Ni/Co efflux regulator RcnB
MQTNTSLTGGILACLIAGSIVAGTGCVYAPDRDRDVRSSRYDPYGHPHDRAYPDRQVTVRIGAYFTDRHRAVIHEYYDEVYRGGHCPPGLAKKHNGCLPPGQAKKWRIGQPHPRDLNYYDLPPHIVKRMGPPPPGYRYSRVAADILLIAIGTGMIVDAIEDLERR